MSNRRSTRSTSTGNPGVHLPQNTSELPAAVRKLQPLPGFNHKASSCKRVTIDSDATSLRKDKQSSSRVTVTKDAVLAPKSYSRFIGETAGLRSLVAEAAICSHCRKGKLIVEFRSVGIATEVHTKCSVCQQWCSSGSMTSKNATRNTDHAANCLFVLALMLCGDGRTEAKTLTGLLDLPTSALIDKTNYPAIEYDISVAIIEYTKELLEQNLLEEIQQWSQDNPSFDYKNWYDSWKEHKPLAFQLMPAIFVSYNMGWQKLSSGKRYDSHSGHAAAVGCKTRKPVAVAVLSRFCRICRMGETTNEDDIAKDNELTHDCLANLEGASGAMEPQASLVDMAHGLLDQYYTVGLEH
jgi:hypothetical protein